MAKPKIPKEVLKQLDIKKVEELKFEYFVSPVVESHQIKLPVPKGIRMEVNFKKGKKLKVKYNPTTKEITYKL